MRRVLTILAATAAVLLLPAAGSAAAAAPHGALTPLPGAGGCLGNGCTPLRGFGSAPSSAQTGNTVSLVPSPDGRELFAVGGSRPALAVLARDPQSGGLTQLAGAAGCFVQTPVPGCTTVADLNAPESARFAADGRTLDVTTATQKGERVVRLRWDAATGTLTPAGVVRGCAATPGGCRKVRGVGHRFDVIPLGTDTQIVVGDARGRGGAFAVLHTDGSGGWEQPAGPTGCFDRSGAGGCTRLPCLNDTTTLAARSSDGGTVYVAGGSTDDELTSQGFVATLRSRPDGGLDAVGCTQTGHDHDAGYAPAWLDPLPNSDTLLILQIRGNRGDGQAWTRFYAASPGASGALAKPVPVSRKLSTGLVSGVASAPDGATIYAADLESGGLTVLGATPTRVSALAPPWGTAYRAPRKFGVYGASSMATSLDGRFVYLAAGAADPSQDHAGPQIRAYAVAG